MRLLIPLFSPATGTWGGLTRVIAIAQAAQQAGHQIAFCAAGYLETTLRQRGYTVYSVPPTTMFGLPAPVSRLIEQRSQQVTLPVKPGKAVGNIWFVLVLSGLARAGYLRRVVEAERRAAQDFQANGLFTDLDPGAFLLAVITGLPIAATYASIALQGVGSISYRWVRRATDAVLKSYGQAPRMPEQVCFGSAVLKIIPSIPELDETDPARPDVRYVGHLLGEIQPAAGPDFVPQAGKRYVFVYVGTGSISLDTLRAVLPQCFPADGQYLCLVGAQSIERVEHIGGVEFRPYVPAAAVLPHCAWTVCHGGQNTIIQSLLYGVPLLIFPGPIFERRYNAHKVQQASAGWMGEVNEFTLPWLTAALETQAACADQAAVLKKKLHSYGSAVAAVEAIARHVQARQAR